MQVDSTAIYCCRFDELRAPLAVTSIGLVKIDVEGAELAVLRGMEGTFRAERVPVLCEILYADNSADIEAHRRKMEATDSFLREIQYVPFRLVVDKSSGRLQQLMRIESLPVTVWTDENQHECDYLLIPAEKAHRYLEAFAHNPPHESGVAA
jgi:hypothetical protein